MIATYASAALICAAALLIGRALFLVAGRAERSWAEPAFGLAAILAVTGLLARAPGRATTAAIGAALLLLAALAILVADGPISRLYVRKSAHRQWGGGARWGEGILVVLVVAVVLSLPFAITGRWGTLGVGFNNDLGLHLAWAEWLRSGFGPTPEAGYPLGPHAFADTLAMLPGIGLGEAFVGQLFAIGAITALTALAALGALPSGRRLLAATLVAVSYLGASYFAQGAFKETVQALFALAAGVGLLELERQRRAGLALLPAAGARGWVRLCLPWLALVGGVFFSYSFAGVAWPVAIIAVWSLTLPEVRAALAPRRLLRLLLHPVTLVGLALLVGLGALMTVAGPLGFIHGFNKVAGTNTYGPVSPVEAFGVWPTPNYRLDAPGGVALPWLAGAVGTLAVALGAVWWWRRRELAVPLALAACALLYLAALPTSGDYSRAKALAILAPLAMLVAIRPLLTELPRRPRSRWADFRTYRREIGPSATGWALLAVVFVVGAGWSSLLALRDAPVGPPGHDAELRSFLPLLAGKPVLYAGQDRYAAHNLRGTDVHVPLVEFPDPEIQENPEKPFDTGDAYSPVDFDSFSRGTLERFPYVITGRAAWNSQAPANYRLIAQTPSFLLWERVGPLPEERQVLLEGVNAGAFAGCEAPEIRILLASPGRASLFPDVVPGPKEAWDAGGQLRLGERTSQRLALEAGRWRLSLQYFTPFPLTLSAPGFSQRLEPALDGQRPNTISLANNGQFWPAGEFRSEGGAYEFTVTADEPNALQRLSGYADTAHVGNLIAVRAGERRIVPLRAACDSWIDWFETSELP